MAGLQASLPVQVGGAAGTLAAATELAGSVDGAIALSDALAAALRLAPAPPWHTTRSAVTRIGDALVTCCDAWGHIAADVATGSRPEIGELAEGEGGGSSTMPHKSNPIRSVLIRRAALTAGPLGATLHTAAAASVDERADGAWHAEWATLRTLARRTVVAAAHTSELLTGLRVDAARAAANLAAADGVLSEQQTMTELTGRAAISGLHRGRRAAGRLHVCSAPATTSRTRHERSASSSSPISADRPTPALLLLGPSLGTSADTLWSEAAAQLSEHVRVIAWDLPGHGRGASTEPFTMAELQPVCWHWPTTSAPNRSTTQAIPSAAAWDCSCCSTRRTASHRRHCCAPAAKIGTPDGWRERAAAVRADRHRSRPRRRGATVVL